MKAITQEFVNVKELLKYLESCCYSEISVDHLTEIIHEMAHEDTVELINETE